MENDIWPTLAGSMQFPWQLRRIINAAEVEVAVGTVETGNRNHCPPKQLRPYLIKQGSGHVLFQLVPALLSGWRGSGAPKWKLPDTKTCAK